MPPNPPRLTPADAESDPLVDAPPGEPPPKKLKCDERIPPLKEEPRDVQADCGCAGAAMPGAAGGEGWQLWRPISA